MAILPKQNFSPIHLPKQKSQVVDNQCFNNFAQAKYTSKILPKQNNTLNSLKIKQVKFLLRQNHYFFGSVTFDKSQFIRSCTLRLALSMLSHDLRM